MRIGLRPAVLLALALTAACAPRTGTRSRPDRERDQNVIRYDELRQNQGTDLLTTVESIRPLWLHKRGPTSFNSEGEIVVYLDNMRYGTAAALSTIDINVVESLQFLPPVDAQARFGMNHPHGAILVFTRRGRRPEG